ncbi:MAG: S9 family peptidase [Actinomycetota bacterium]|nr:S9 family peptidase [Actinomycetota bacterium]
MARAADRVTPAQESEPEGPTTGRHRVTAGMVAHNRSQAEPLEDRRGRVAYLESYNNSGDLWVSDPGSGWPRQVTTHPRASAGGSYRGGFLGWFPDGLELVFVGEDDQLWVSPDIGGEAQRLTELPGRCFAPAVSPDGSQLAFVYSTSHRTDVVVAPLGSKAVGEGDVTAVNRSDFAFDPEWSPDGRLLAWHEWDVPNMPWDEGRIVAARPDGSERWVVDGVEWAVAQPRFSPDGRWLAYLSERSGWVNLWVADTATWVTRHLVDEPAEHGSPGWRARVRTYAWSPDSDAVLFIRNQGGTEVLARVSLEEGEVVQVGRLQGALRDLSWRRNPVLVVGSSTLPRALVTLDEAGSPAIIADDGLAAWDGLPLAQAEPVSFPAEDGAALHGWLWRPPDGQRSPLLLYCHGGPNGQVKDDWFPIFQYWVHRGYAVLAVNYRGSTGYGRDYRDALLGRWGELDVADGAAAARWALHEGAGTDGVVAWGGSAGGYLVLMLLALHGDLFAGGVNLFGVTDLEHLARSTHRFEAHYLDRLVGPLPEAEGRYRQRSPVHLSERIGRPLLTFQGEEDEVVPLEQSEALHRRLRDRGVTAELVVYPGEGHGFARVDTLLDYLARMEAFLGRIGLVPGSG